MFPLDSTLQKSIYVYNKILIENVYGITMFWTAMSRSSSTYKTGENIFSDVKYRSSFATFRI